MIDEDIKFGLDLEFEHYELLKNKFDKSLEKNTYKYALFDYIGDKCFIELKSRRNEHNKYKDTMIGCNKLLFARNCAKEVYFVFCFTDGLYFWKYNEGDMKTGNVEFRTGGRNDRGKEEYKDYAFIKTNILEKI